MSTALVMDFYSNVLEQALKGANEADAGVGTAGILINRQGPDPSRSDSAMVAVLENVMCAVPVGNQTPGTCLCTFQADVVG